MKIHFIGIGGIGMSALAKLALRLGHSVSGSDIKESLLTKRLSELGAQLFIGHNENNLCNDTEVVVYSSAISPDNSEIVKAKRINLAIWERAKMLKFLMEGKTTITITGSHGKTTTTSLIASILINAGLNPTVAAGGMLVNLDDNAVLGSGKYFVAEADESDGSFMHYEPDYSVITNVDYEHLDYYKDIDSIKNEFVRFMDKTKREGCIFCCSDDLILKSIINKCRKRIFLFGLDSKADIYADNIKLSEFSSTFNCYCYGVDLGRFYLNAAGIHNVRNALACIGVASKIGINKDIISSALSNFKGTSRRFQVKFKDNGLLVIDDYAHHPTEIKAVLTACKNIAHKRLIVVFQPHRYSRVYYLFDKFTSCFDEADKLFITDIYAAGEKPHDSVNVHLLCDAIAKRNSTQVNFVEKHSIADTISNLADSGDLILFLGAGDITKICDDFVETLKQKWTGILKN